MFRARWIYVLRVEEIAAIARLRDIFGTLTKHTLDATPSRSL